MAAPTLVGMGAHALAMPWPPTPGAPGCPGSSAWRVYALLQILALAVILAINNFFGAVSLGAVPLDAGRRWAITGLFALSDCGLPLVGVLLGASLARAVGPAAAYMGIAMIMLTGVYVVFGLSRSGRVTGRRRAAERASAGRAGEAAVGGHVGHGTPERPAEGRAAAGDAGIAGLVVTAVALGLDNLGAAIGLGATGVNLPLTLGTFAVVTGGVTALGLAVGGIVHRRLPGDAANGLAGALLFGTGLTMLVVRLRGGG